MSNMDEETEKGTQADLVS